MVSPVFGHHHTIAEFLKARNSGRFHHAWLFEGPKGTGKATAALNLATHLLGAENDLTADRYSVCDGEVRQHIVAGSHPDFRIIRKEDHETGKPRQDIAVDDLRKLSGFFSLKPAMGGYRVAIVDSIDELNPNGANALLKTLEEPPKNCVLILIYHRQAGLLPTIRSRCQRLRFSPMGDDLVRKILAHHSSDVDISDKIIHLAAGSPGKALAYLQADSTHLLTVLEELTEKSWPRVGSDQFNRLLRAMSSSEILFDLTLHYIEDWFKSKIESQASIVESAAIAKTWEAIQIQSGQSVHLKLDLTERSAKCVAQLQSLAKRLEKLHVV